MIKKEIILLCVALGLCWIDGRTQEKPKPKSRPVVLEGDSSRTSRSDKLEGRKGDKDSLELPDVVVFGEENITRLPHPKLAAPSERAQLEELETERPALPQTQLEGSEKETVATPARTGHTGLRMRAAGGQYQQYDGLVSVWHISSGYELGSEASYFHNEGEFENSRSRQFHLNGQAGVRFSSNVQTRVLGSFQGENFGLHGSQLPQHERDSQYGEVGLSGRWQTESLTRLHLQGTLLFGRVKDTAVEFEPDLPRESDWRTAGADGLFETQLGGLMVTTKLGLLDDKIMISDTANGVRLSKFEGELSWHPASRLRLGAGIVVNHADPYDGDTETHIAPLLRANWLPHADLSLSAEFSGGLFYKPFYQHLRQNRFLALDSHLDTEKRHWQLDLKSEFRVADALLLKAGYHRQLSDRFPSWIQSIDTGLFSFEYLDDVTISDFTFELQARPLSALLWTTSVHLLGDQVERPPDRVSISSFDLPYRGRLWVETALEVRPATNVSFIIETSVVNNRRVRLGSPQRLDAFVDTDFKADWKPTPVFSFFAEIQNLLDRDYEWWQDYPEMGFNVVGGVRANW